MFASYWSSISSTRRFCARPSSASFWESEIDAYLGNDKYKLVIVTPLAARYGRLMS